MLAAVAKTRRTSPPSPPPLLVSSSSYSRCSPSRSPGAASLARFVLHLKDTVTFPSRSPSPPSEEKISFRSSYREKPLCLSLFFFFFASLSSRRLKPRKISTALRLLGIPRSGSTPHPYAFNTDEKLRSPRVPRIIPDCLSPFDKYSELCSAGRRNRGGGQASL